MSNVVPIERKRSRRLRMLVDGKITEYALDDIWQDEIERRRRCIEDAKANIKRAIGQLQIETGLIDQWEAEIAEIEARRSGIGVLIDFPTLAQRGKGSGHE